VDARSRATLVALLAVTLFVVGVAVSLDGFLGRFYGGGMPPPPGSGNPLPAPDYTALEIDEGRTVLALSATGWGLALGVPLAERRSRIQLGLALSGAIELGVLGFALSFILPALSPTDVAWFGTGATEAGLGLLLSALSLLSWTLLVTVASVTTSTEDRRSKM
jgi:hypothetical protein